MAKDQQTNKNWFARHKVMTVILGIIIIAVIASASSGGSKSSNTIASADKTQTKSDTKAPAVTIGQTAKDGQFEFIVKSVTCGKPSVTDSSGYVTKTAQGQYCLMDLTVKNIGNKQQYFSESDQKLLNASGQQYSADTTATLTNSNNSDAFLAQINPGNSVSGILVFDIPKDQQPTTAELHDSSFSGGVKVTVQ